MLLDVRMIQVKNDNQSFTKLSLLIYLLVEAQPQCYTNSECLNSEVCNQGSCLDACRLTVCGSNARCSSLNHTATCQCPLGYEGNPQSACYACESITHLLMTIFIQFLIHLR